MHYGSESRSYDVIEDVGSSLQHTVTDLYDDQDYYFAVTAYNEYGESTLSDELVYLTPHTSANQAPTIDAGTDQTTTLPENSVLLDGTVTDDGLPNSPGTTSTSWGQVSGPATASIDNPADVDTRLTFSVAGTYVWHLEANDGSLSAGDEVTIIVYPEIVNQAPDVNAGTDQTTTLPENSVLLDGTVTDDGLPNPPGATITTWSQVSGPAAVSFDDTSKVAAWASFPDTGTYVLNLEADDGESIVSDDVTITVNHTNAGPYLEKGVVQDVSNGDWTTVTLTRYYTSMVVVCTPNYDSTSPPVIVRVDEAEGDSFQVRVDRTDGANTLIEGVTIHYMVVEQGVYTEADHGVKMEAVKFLSTITDENNSWVGQSMPYSNSYTNPVILGQVMTYNDSRFSTFWSCGSSRTDPPNSSNLKVGKTALEDPVDDPDNIRVDEVIGYIVIEAGSGDIEGVEYAAALGNNSVRGVDDAPPYNYTLNALFTPEVAIASQSAMDGGDGGWAVLYGDKAVTTGMLNLVIDEDQSGDSERAHTTEQVGYVVFENSGVLPIPASKPNPANGATNVSTTPALSWTAGSGAIFHDVYFGTDSSPGFIGSQEGSTFDPGTLDEETTYYWRIDENGDQGTTSGIVWSFTTGSDPEPLWVQLSYDDFESGWGSYTDGGRDCSLYTRGTYAHQGNNAVNIQDNSGTGSSFSYTMGIDTDTPGFSQLEIDFWFKAISMDNSEEDFQVQYYDGSTWHTVASYAVEADFENNVFYNNTVYIDESSYTFPKDMKIRFVCDASSNWDDVYIDEVRVSAK